MKKILIAGMIFCAIPSLWAMERIAKTAENSEPVKQSSLSAEEQQRINQELFEFVQSENATVEEVQRLLAQGAQANACIDCDNGFNIYAEKDLEIGNVTPLHAAAAHGKTAICQCLINNGADADAVDATDWPALGYAMDQNHAETSDLLLERGTTKGDVFSSQFGQAEWLLQKALAIKLESQESWDFENQRYFCLGESREWLDKKFPITTDLHQRAKDGNTQMCAVFLKHGANIHARDASGRTPLHVAAEHEQYETCLLFLVNGADVNATDYHARTPLDCAALSSPVCCSLLVRFGGNMTHNALNLLNRPSLTNEIRPALRSRIGSLMAQAFFIPPKEEVQSSSGSEASSESSWTVLPKSILQGCNALYEKAIGNKPNTPYTKVTTILACLKKLRMPTDVQYKFFLLDNDLMGEVCKTLLPKLQRGFRSNSQATLMETVPLAWRPTIVSWIYTYTMQQLAHSAEEASPGMADPEMLALLDRKTLEGTFGQAICENIAIRLGFHPWISHSITWN